MSITIEHDKAYFWSDLHLFHKGMARIRGFGEDVAKMDAGLLHHARLVPAEATLFLLGDVSFGKFEETKAWLDQVACRKVLVMGNHDSGLAKHLDNLFDEVHHILRVKVVEYTGPEGHKKKNKLDEIICCHYPMLVWDKMHHGSWHLHGHSHGSLHHPGKVGKMMDVGVDAYPGVWGPLSYAEVKAFMDTREIVSYDHHKPDTQRSEEWRPLTNMRH